MYGISKNSACRMIAAFAAFVAASNANAQTPAAQGGPTMLSTSLTPENLDRLRLTDFERLLDEASHTDDFVGLAVAVVRHGEIQLLKTYGVREVGGDAAVTPNTVFRVGSLSKGFASTLAGIAMADGRLALETPVAPYEPRFALKGGAEARVTVEDILSHRTSLPPNAYDNLLEDGVAVTEILSRLRNVKPICSVGSCYAYQNVAYAMIGDVLSAVYHEPYADLVRERIFAPLGMRTASVGEEGLAATGDWARPHIRERSGDKASPQYGPWRSVTVKDAYYRTPGAGGVNASINDMALWLKAQMGDAPAVLSESVLSTIHTARVDTPAEKRRWDILQGRLNDAKYALGWRIYDYGGHALINHSGTVEGYAAQIAWLPERDVGIVILANTRAERVWRILPAFLDNELGLNERDWLALNDGKARFSVDGARASGD